MHSMLRIAAIFSIGYGVISIGGGTEGYLVKKSVPSIVAGGVSGLLLILAGVLTYTGRPYGLWLAVAVAIALTGRFLPAFLKDRSKLWPALVMAVLGIATIVIDVLALAV